MLHPEKGPRFDVSNIPSGSAEHALRAVFDPEGDDPETDFQIRRILDGSGPVSPGEVIGIGTALALLQRNQLSSLNLR